VPTFQPRSGMTSFSTTRNDSNASLASSMRPPLSTHGSFSQPGMNEFPYSSNPDYVSQLTGGFQHGAQQGGNYPGENEADNEEFGHLF
jgi:hypothetical protein